MATAPDITGTRRRWKRWGVLALLPIVPLVFVAWSPLVGEDRLPAVQAVAELEQLGGTAEVATVYRDWVPVSARPSLAFPPFRRQVTHRILIHGERRRGRGGEAPAPRDERVATSLKLVPNFPNIASLSVESATISDDDLAPLQLLRTLDEISLNFTTVNGSGLRHLRHTRVRSIRIYDGLLTDDGLASLAEVPRSLVILSLSGERVTDQITTHLTRFPLLRDLDLRRTSVRGARFHELPPRNSIEWLGLAEGSYTDEVLRTLSRWTNLRTLNISGPAVTNAGVRALGLLPHLEHLSVECPGVTCAAFDDPALFPNLRHLAIRNTALDAGQLRALTGLPLLDSVSFNATAIADADLAQLERFPNLKTVRLVGTRVTGVGFANLKLPKLEEVELRNTPTTDEGIAALAHFPLLRRVNMQNTQVTDAALTHLAAMPSIKEVVGRTRHLSTSAQEEFRTKRPDAILF